MSDEFVTFDDSDDEKKSNKPKHETQVPKHTIMKPIKPHIQVPIKNQIKPENKTTAPVIKTVSKSVAMSIDEEIVNVIKYNREHTYARVKDDLEDTDPSEFLESIPFKTSFATIKYDGYKWSKYMDLLKCIGRSFIGCVLIPGHLVIAGGATFTMFGINSNDVDFFFVDIKPVDAEKAIKNACDEIIKFYKSKDYNDCNFNEYDKCVINSFKIGPQGDNPLKFEMYQNKNCVSLYVIGEEEIAKFQFILRIYNTISEIPHGFDIPTPVIDVVNDMNCRFWTTRYVRFILKYRCIIADTSKRSINFDHRLAKFFDKGFSVILPGLKHSKDIRFKFFVSNDKKTALINYHDVSDYEPKYNEKCCTFRNLKNIKNGGKEIETTYNICKEINKYESSPVFNKTIIKKFYDRIKISSTPLHYVMYFTNKEKYLNAVINGDSINDLVDDEFNDACKVIDSIHLSGLEWKLSKSENDAPQMNQERVISHYPFTPFTSSFHPVIAPEADWYGDQFNGVGLDGLIKSMK